MNDRATSRNRSAGARFRAAVAAERPLQIIGTINAYHARLAERVGYRAIYLSGGGVAAGSLGVPDLGISTLDDVLTDIRRITDVCDLPLLVDVDTGFGGAFNIARTVKSLIKFGAGAMHIEDQVMQKRCGHRPNKEIVSKEEMVDRIKAAADAKTDPRFRDHGAHRLARGGRPAGGDRPRLRLRRSGRRHDLPGGDHRAVDVQEIRRRGEGADPRQHHRVRHRRRCSRSRSCASANVAMALYPLSAFRAMNAAALRVYQGIRKDGTQKGVVELMQSRDELYDYLDYHAYEQKLDALFARDKKK